MNKSAAERGCLESLLHACLLGSNIMGSGEICSCGAALLTKGLSPEHFLVLAPWDKCFGSFFCFFEVVSSKLDCTNASTLYYLVPNFEAFDAGAGLRFFLEPPVFSALTGFIARASWSRMAFSLFCFSFLVLLVKAIYLEHLESVTLQDKSGTKCVNLMTDMALGLRHADWTLISLLLDSPSLLVPKII